MFTFVQLVSLIGLWLIKSKPLFDKGLSVRCPCLFVYQHLTKMYIVKFVLAPQDQLVQLEHGAKTDCLDPRVHKDHEDRKAKWESLVPQDSLVIEERPDLLVSTVSVKYM